MSLGAPTAVQLICFYAEGGDGHVGIEWETASELETLGFNLLRSEHPEGPFEDISGFVPHCDDGGLVGGLYRFSDQSVTNGVAYYYRLKEMVSDQHYVYYPPQDELPLVAVPNLPTLTPTEQIPPSPTSTLRPTSTPTTTSTPSPTPSNTPRPTSTAAPPGSPPPTGTPSSTVVARTFTPTPTSSAGATASHTSIVSPSLPVYPVATVAISGEATTLTPEIVAAAMTSALESPLATPPAGPSPTGYPLGTLAAPTRTPFPTDYVPPPTRSSPNQIATMTPADLNGPDGISGNSGDGPSPRVWLYIGFVGAVLLLIGGLFLMMRQGNRGGGNLMPSEQPKDLGSGDERDP